MCGTQAAARRTTLKNLELTKPERDCGGGGRRETRGTVTVFALTAVFRRHRPIILYLPTKHDILQFLRLLPKTAAVLINCENSNIIEQKLN